MKSQSIKRLLTAVLVSAMLAGSTLSVAASSASGNSAGSSSSGNSVDRSESDSSESDSSDSGSSESAAPEESAPAFPEVDFVSADGNVSVAGTSVRSTVAGAVKVDTLQGAVVTTPLAEVKANLGLSGSQTPYVIAFDTNAKKSNLAMNCVDAAAESLGGQVVTAINVTLGAKENGKLISLSNGSAGMVVGLPKNADTSKTYSVVCVQPGGVVTILADQDSSPATVTFAIKAGLGTYGIVAK